MVHPQFLVLAQDAFDALECLKGTIEQGFAVQLPFLGKI